jgi:broad specificity phosphatase PhoE
MKTIEIRRHSIRATPGQNLSQPGVSLARLIGEEMGRFERVITSPLPRAYQTAIAMGFAVDATSELLATYGDEVNLECPWPASFSEYAAAAGKNGATTRYARALADFYQKLAESLTEGAAALVVNHGGVVELSAVGCLPEGDLDSLGDYIEYCEGVRLTWENGAFTSAQILRV